MKMLNYVRSFVTISLGNEWTGFVNGKKVLSFENGGSNAQKPFISFVQVYLVYWESAENYCGHSPAAAYLLLSRTRFKCVDMALLFSPSRARQNLIEYLICFRKVQVSAHFSVIPTSLAKWLSHTEASGKQSWGNWIKLCVSMALPGTEIHPCIMGLPRT